MGGDLILQIFHMHMKQTQKLFSPPIMNSHSMVQRKSPTLHDSKSFSYLPNFNDPNKDNHKFRQTTYYPVSTKNANYEFLRYSVNPTKNSRDAPIKIDPKPRFGYQRKLTYDNVEVPEEQKSRKYGHNVKASSRLATMQDYPINRNKIIDQKYPIENQVSSNKIPSQKLNEKSQGLKVYRTKTAFYTPKRTINTELQKPQTPINSKVGAYISSSDLLKDLASSPTSESTTSRRKSSKKATTVDDFYLGKFLGEGKFGHVYMAIHKQTLAVFALKKIKKECIKKNKLEEQFLMEIKMQLHFNHPNILKLYGFFDDQEHIYLILEYMEEGTLYSHFKKNKALKQDDASRKLRDVLSAVAYMHSKSIAHRDIKPQNVVISNDVCKLCDFGWAAICDSRRQTMCGTIDYASPQLLEGKQYGIAIDLWCLGVLCFQLMVGKAPFYHISRKQTMKKIVKADTSDLSIPSHISTDTRDFIYRLLRKDPQERMSAQNAIHHRLIQKYKDEQIEELRKNVEKQYN